MVSNREDIKFKVKTVKQGTTKQKLNPKRRNSKRCNHSDGQKNKYIYGIIVRKCDRKHRENQKTFNKIQEQLKQKNYTIRNITDAK